MMWLDSHFAITKKNPLRDPSLDLMKYTHDLVDKALEPTVEGQDDSREDTGTETVQD